MEYSYKEVKKHNTVNDCWIILYDKVYDITNFMEKHSGKYFPLQVAGKDGTGLFESIHPKNAKKILESVDFQKKYYKGTIIKNKNNKFNYNSKLGIKLKKYIAQYFKSVENTPRARGGVNEKICIYSKFFIIIFLSCWTKYKQFKTGELKYSILYGICKALIIFNISHGANHGELIKRYPKLFSNISEKCHFLLGQDNNDWKRWHNVSHHQYTNTHQDMDTNRTDLNRLHNCQNFSQMYKYQHIYTWFLIYPFTHIYAFVMEKNNFSGYIKYIMFNLILLKTISRNSIFFFIKNLLIESFTFGFLFVMINHVTHTNDKTEYREQTEGCWYENQLKSTANWSCNNILLTNLLGGINYQIEHHLFQSVPHYHYPFLRKIIKKVCKKEKIPYLEFNSYFDALHSHYRLLKKLSKP